MKKQQQQQKKLFNYAIPDSVYKAKQSRVW